MRHRTTLLLATVVAFGTVGAVTALGRPAEFSHRTHTRLFPASCTTCHAGAADPAQSIWPTAASCATCHDGEAEARVDWSARTTPPASNLRFTHARHARETADSVGCLACHAGTDPRGEVHLSEASQCISCHVPGGRHHSVPDRECATCHVPLAEATRLSDLDVARIRAPASHRDSTFRLEGHGRLAIPASREDGTGVSRSCATCHARNFCVNCHVNAPETAAIQALAPDPRSLFHDFTFGAPASHASPSFLTAHGREASRSPARCATCHAKPSCAACHAAPLPRAVAGLPTPGPGRAAGAMVERRPPPSHTVEFREGHGTAATATPRSCTTCHARQECLSCHRGTGVRGGGDYHPTDFVARHPTVAYNRQVSCGDCHNTQQFCASCHRQAGLGGGNTLGGANYHDGKAAFFVGHGQAARQSLESCVSCHAERDCTACHSAIGGRRFSPHGPGFDAERLRRRNPEMCIACHGRAIPGG